METFYSDSGVFTGNGGPVGRSGLQEIGGQALKKLMADGFNADEVARWAATVGARRLRELAGRYNADAMRHYGAEFFARYRGATDDTIEHVATFDGIKKGEIKGTHDADTFAALFDGPKSYGEVLARTPHPANPLIENIEYKLYKRGKDSTVDIPPTLSEGRAKTKTVLSGLATNKDYWKRLANEAADTAINAKRMSPEGGAFQEVVLNGLEIRGYLRGDSLDTFFVVW